MSDPTSMALTGARSPLPSDPAERKRVPLATGCFDYFAAALAEVAKVSFVGNEKHNPGQPLHHARGKSNDHPDAMLRHFEERGGIDEVTLPDGRVFRIRHSAEMAWRALAILQEELEAAGLAPLARGARLPEPEQGQPERWFDGYTTIPCAPPEPAQYDPRDYKGLRAPPYKVGHGG